MINIENEIKDQVSARLKQLLFDENVTQYRNHETFYSNSNRPYQFLVWKLQPTNIEEFGNEMQQLVEKNGYQCIPGASEVTTYNPD